MKHMNTINKKISHKVLDEKNKPTPTSNSMLPTQK